jgi:hypothetical protein
MAVDAEVWMGIGRRRRRRRRRRIANLPLMAVPCTLSPVTRSSSPEKMPDRAADVHHPPIPRPKTRT